jgi:hypothetical protein
MEPASSHARLVAEHRRSIAFIARTLHVCLWHKAGITIALSDVRFRGQSGHCEDAIGYPLVTQSRHRLGNFAVTHNSCH